MKITDIEIHSISIPYVDWIAYPLNHYHGPSRRTIYVAHTDNGLVGLGESGAPEPRETIDQYLGSNPYTWIGDETSLGLGMAMYDLMGQAAGVPVYQLFGQQHRSWVPIGAWTVSTHPKRMAEAVTRYAARGYTWMKYHLSPFENVFDQTEAMQKVAPPGFKIHYDFTGGGTDDHMPELLGKLAQYPIAGCFEDPIHEGDIQGSIELRQRIPLPIVRHRAPLEASYEVLMGAGDAYIRGHQKIGAIIRTAGLLAAGNIPFAIQNVGGTITRAMTVHMKAAFPTATLHSHSDAETWSHDVVAESLEPINGLVRVPEKPGLGLTLDREKLAYLKNIVLEPQQPWIIKSRFRNGTVMYHNFDQTKSGHFLVRPDWHRGLIPMSYAAPIETEYWDDDGSPEFKTMQQRLTQEGMILERENGH